MPSATHLPLHEQQYSLHHDRFIQVLGTTQNLLVIQDLDGVCMGLVKDPLNRQIDPAYVRATQALDRHFYVLTNGEHIGQRGVNGIIERAFGDVGQVQTDGHYLPGLAAGGVQWQTRYGDISHPGVSDQELAFLKKVPNRIRTALQTFANAHALPLDDGTLEHYIQASALDNIASPTANLNTLHGALQGDRDTYVALQKAMASLMDTLLKEAAEQGLADSFFVHYAPNHGRAADGKEIIWFSQADESGTTDFQFMLRGAIKEAGVLALLNRYYGQHFDHYPLGTGFSARQAPHTHHELLELVKTNFDPAHMPTMIGVGDTVTSKIDTSTGTPIPQRGGSDRNFLQLVQDIGQAFDTGNVVVYVDSSGGELKNRKPLSIETIAGEERVTEGPGDPGDVDDPLTLNLVFPDGYRQYCEAFQAGAQRRASGT